MKLRIEEDDPLKHYMDLVCAVIPTQLCGNVINTKSVSVTAPPVSKEIIVQYHKEVGLSFFVNKCVYVT
jgi:hypothetical protein